MNLASWILLIAILALCSFIVYRRFLTKSEGGCADCPACASNNKKSCCS
ncbi:FeoB-associated Cys-rich membrane protein [uncultured Anaerococcus sp.]|nr:FeoB-associated Cys-rich membrane protein [uncultured Anaerococcus sp.]